MVTFRRNLETGVVEAYKNGNKIGSIKAMQEMQSETKPHQTTVTQVNNNNRVITVNRRK